MKPPKIIALTGPKGVGTSTLANLIMSNQVLPHPVGIMSFAGGLKAMLATILPPEAFTPEGKENPEYGLCGKKPRELMQTLGTEWGRDKVSENIWVDVMEKKILKSGLQSVIIDDLRFVNEWAMVKKLGGVVIALERRGCAYTNEHASEKPIGPHLVDCVLDLDRVHANHLSTVFNPFL